MSISWSFRFSPIPTLILLITTLLVCACTSENSATPEAGSIGKINSTIGVDEAANTVTSNADVLPIYLPACDPSNPEVRFIKNNNDWADINNPSYRIFCVHPGDYTGWGTISITADGEPGNERWIRLYDPLRPNDDTTHPVAVVDSQRVIVERFYFGLDGDPAKNWFVDRVTKRGGSLAVWEGSENIVINRMLMEQGHQSLLSILNAKNVTLQNSVLRQTMVIPNADIHCIIIGRTPHGTRIINNEIYDCAGDGIQFAPSTTGGALISNNDIYLTPAMYSNCQGSLDPSGSCACAENAIDMKGPGSVRPLSLPEQEWVRIEDNRIWGFRPTDTSCGGTGSTGQSLTIGSGYDNHVNFTLIRDNIIMDGPTGIEIGVATVDHISIIGNLIYGMTKKREDTYPGAITNLSGDAVEIYLNTIINASHWLRTGAKADQNDVRCNIAIDGNDVPFPGVGYDDASKVDYNFFYNTMEYTTEGELNHDLVFDSSTGALHGDYCFYRRLLTGQEWVCIPNGQINENSPHRTACDSNLGQQRGIGVSDETWAEGSNSWGL